MGETCTTTSLTLNLLGPFEARVDGFPIPPLRTRKGAWLLALLTLRHPRPVERAWLAGTLWPLSGEREAYAGLRRCLTDLRHALDGHAGCIQAPTARTLRLDLSAGRVDVLEFDAALARGDAASLEQAVGLYRGPLLEGCGEEWVVAERRAREEGCLHALERLGGLALEAGDPEAAAGWFRRATALDPLRETAWRGLLRALADDGCHAAALEAYRELRDLLRREVNAEPAPETFALFHRIRAEAREQARRGSGLTTTAGWTLAAPRGPAREVRLPVVSTGDDRRPTPNVHLPRPLTEFVGRRSEIAEITALLGGARLLTLAGPGGIGKTRLAIEAASVAAGTFPDGVWFVDLEPLDAPGLAIQATVSALGLRDLTGLPVGDALAAHLARKRLLLVLDNCEHLASECAVLAEALLQAAPAVRILVTSRHALGLPAETVWRVPSLSLGPDPDESEAVRLFLQRAAAVRPSFTFTADNAPLVAQICRRLDGIPLALELAAARLNMLSVPQIAARLDNRFQLLTRGSPTALPRQQTLRATMEWSCALLSPEESALLRRLSVFPGSFGLDAVEYVLGCEGSEAGALDLLGALVDKSLVWVEEEAGEARYRLLETTREYAREVLRAAREETDARKRHASCFLALAEQAASATAAEQRQWLDRLAIERDNLRAALAWLLSERGASVSGPDPHEGEAGLRLAAALAPFWLARGPAAEGLRWIERALSVHPAPTAAQAAALMAAGTLAFAVTGWLRGKPLLLEAAEVFSGLGDRRGMASAFSMASTAANRLAELPSARSLGRRSLAIFRELNDPAGIVRSLCCLARAAWLSAELPEACRLLEEADAVARESDDRIARLRVLHAMGLLTYVEGNFSASLAFHGELLAICRELGDRSGVAWALNNLGDAALAAGQTADARIYYRESLALFREQERLHGMVECLRGLAQVIVAENRSPEAVLAAVRLFGAQNAARTASHHPVDPIRVAEYEASQAAAAAILGDAAYAAAFAAGSALSLDDAAAEALRA